MKALKRLFTQFSTNLQIIDEDEFSEDFDDEGDYRDDNDLDLDFDKFHLKHGNREIASSPEESEGNIQVFI